MGEEPELPGQPSPIDLTNIPYSPQSYQFDIPSYFPAMAFDQSKVTVEGVELGRRLFYDPVLSKDSTISCASCHQQENSFNTITQFAEGINEQFTDRSSLSILNVAFYNKGLFWDGRAMTLETQAEGPITDPKEMGHSFAELEEKLRLHPVYPELFRKAFGIATSEDIERNLIVNAISQFESTLITGNSKYDRVLRGEEFFTEDELNGWDMFFDVSPELPDAECGHCHNGPLLTNFVFANNGLDPIDLGGEFADPGRGGVTGLTRDNGVFRTPTLRNIELTAPYMHDGRFQTLEEVIDHYNSSPNSGLRNVDPLIYPLGLTEQEKEQLLAFLKTLTDYSILENPEFRSPFD